MGAIFTDKVPGGLSTIIESVQRGSSDLGSINAGSTETITIASVDTSKSDLFYKVSGPGTVPGGVGARLSGGTTIEVEAYNIANAVNVDWQVVEFV